MPSIKDRKDVRASVSDPCGAGGEPLAVGPEEVVQLVEASYGWLVAEGAVWSAAIVEVQPAGEGGVAFWLSR